METATRYSPKREAILKCLRSTTCHPSAEWVYTQLKPQIPDLSLATVYRNLARFRSESTVQVIGCVDGEDRYDGNVAPHGHFICRAISAWRKRKSVDNGCFLDKSSVKIRTKQIFNYDNGGKKL